MAGLLTFTLLAFSALFVVVDPIAVVPLFISLTPNDSADRRREMATRACLVAWGILVAFAIGGSVFFRLLGITIGAFKVAGGLLLLLTAIDQLRAQPARTRTTIEEQHEGIKKEDISVVPLGMPLLAGPGAIATTMVLIGRAQNLMERLIVFGAVTFAVGSSFLALLSAERIVRRLGTTGRLILERLSGLVLASIAVQFVLNGAAEVWRQ
jgi:multiple antibiotic resistance protein